MSAVDDARVLISCNCRHLHKWAESDYEFIKSRKSATGTVANKGRGSMFGPSRAADGYSYRQLYLRSYTFTREEDTNEKVIRCLARIGDMAARGGDNIRRGLRKVKKGSCFALKAAVRACWPYAFTWAMQKKIYVTDLDLLMEVIETYGYTFD